METRSPKMLAVAVDFNDNIAGHEPTPKRCYTPEEIDDMIEYFLTLGVRRFYWFHDAHNGLYEDPFGGAENLLAFACEVAHEKGMEFFSVIKPFETGLQMRSIPPHLDPPARATKTIQGWHIFASEFAANHPDMRLRFQHATPSPPGSGQISRIELVNRDTGGESVGASDIDILWSDKNSQYRLYDGPISSSSYFRSTPTGEKRVIKFDDLNLPESARYILVRYTGTDHAEDFANAPGKLLELYDDAGQLQSQPDQYKIRIGREMLLGCNLDLPEDTRKVIESEERCHDAYTNHYRFDSTARPLPDRTLNTGGGYICHCLDFNSHCAGALHPGYPQVREYWLDRVKSSIQAGVDGVALRIANHSSWCSRPNQAGFNEPALKEYAHRTGKEAEPDEVDLDLLRHINGDFYTQFLRECSELVRDHDKQMQHFVQPLMDNLQDNIVNNVPGTFNFDYRAWMREGLLDGVCIRQMGAENTPPNWRLFGDMVGAQARLFGMEMFYANANGPINRAVSHNEVPNHIGDEIKHVNDSDLFDGFILYEAAQVMGVDESGTFCTSPKLESMIQSNWSQTESH